MLRFNQKNFASEPKSESVHSSLSMIVLVYVLFYVHEVEDLAINHDDAIREFTISEFFIFFHHNTSISVLEVAISALK